MILRSHVVRLLLHAMFVSYYVLLSASGRICCQSSHSTAQFALPPAAPPPSGLATLPSVGAVP